MPRLSSRRDSAAFFFRKVLSRLTNSLWLSLSATAGASLPAELPRPRKNELGGTDSESIWLPWPRPIMRWVMFLNNELHEMYSFSGNSTLRVLSQCSQASCRRSRGWSRPPPTCRTTCPSGGSSCGARADAGSRTGSQPLSKGPRVSRPPLHPSCRAPPAHLKNLGLREHAACGGTLSSGVAGHLLLELVRPVQVLDALVPQGQKQLHLVLGAALLVGVQEALCLVAVLLRCLLRTGLRAKTGKQRVPFGAFHFQDGSCLVIGSYRSRACRGGLGRSCLGRSRLGRQACAWRRRISTFVLRHPDRMPQDSTEHAIWSAKVTPVYQALEPKRAEQYSCYHAHMCQVTMLLILMLVILLVHDKEQRHTSSCHLDT